MMRLSGGSRASRTQDGCPVPGFRENPQDSAVIQDGLGGPKGIFGTRAAVQFVISPQEGDDARPERGVRCNGPADEFYRPGSHADEGNRVDETEMVAHYQEWSFLRQVFLAVDFNMRE